MRRLHRSVLCRRLGTVRATRASHAAAIALRALALMLALAPEQAIAQAGTPSPSTGSSMSPGGSTAEGAPTAPSPGAPEAAPAPPGGEQAPGPGVVPAPPNTVYMPYGLPPPGFDPNAYLPSSSQPTLDINRPSDHFDLGRPVEGPSIIYGNKEGTAILPGEHVPPVEGAANVPPLYEVRRGDTLWSICARFFNNPWEWPRVWALNPELQNPHWIYPGEQLRLRPAPPPEGQPATPRPPPAPSLISGGPTTLGGPIGRRPLVPPQTVFLRDQGYLDDVRDEWGQVGGSPDDQMLLSQGNIVYLDMIAGHDVAPGQELTVFRPLGRPKHGDAKGQLVQVLGTARVNGWNPRTRIARAELTESLEVVQRGAKVGPIERKFDVVPPVQNAVEVRGHIVASLHPYVLFGQNQVVFIDRGGQDGLIPGNRLFVLEQGDGYRRTLQGASDFAAADVRYESDKPAVTVRGGALGSERDDKYPEEVVGELRVLRTRDHSAACLVTSSKHELEAGQTVIAKAGY